MSSSDCDLDWPILGGWLAMIGRSRLPRLPSEPGLFRDCIAKKRENMMDECMEMEYKK